MEKPENTTTITEQPEQAENHPNTGDAPEVDLAGKEESSGVARYAAEFVDKPADTTNGHLKGAAIKAYASHARQVRADELVVKFLPLVHKIVHQVVSYLRPPLTREDLVSAGTIGLVKAARDFDPAQQAEFKTYAYIRVRGAVIDELRGWSFAPAGLKKQFDQAQRTMREMTESNGYLPSDQELAQQIGMSVEKMHRMFENARARHFLSIHGVSDESPALGESLMAKDTSQPGDRLEKAELLERLTRAIQELPDRQREIIILYYSKELTMKSIADVLKVTESRVSQLHASALFKLSVKLKQFDDTKA
jgi:RNA polymerase sigma factor for flagellar operon FliA